MKNTILAAALVALSVGLAVAPDASACGHRYRRIIERPAVTRVVEQTLVQPAVVETAAAPVCAAPVVEAPVCVRRHHHLLGVYTPIFGFHLF